MMPRLRLLKLSKINSGKLWDDNVPGCSFIQNLRSLTIDKCDKIAYTFSSSVARELVNLKHLAISNCQMLEEIFQKPFSNDEVVFPNLETLEISHMEQLKSLWHNQLASNSFCKLKQLKIQFCNKLSNVFPSYVLDKLQNLEIVTVTCCHALEVVFEMQGLKEDSGRQTRLEMKLGTLMLNHLPMLKDIWSGRHVDVFHCDKLIVFKPKSVNNQDIVPVDTLPLLSIEKVVRNTSKLILNSKDVTLLCNGELNDEHIYKVPDLCLRCFHDESDKFPSSFLQRFNNLENLK
ncbi:NBS-LRR type disease resistance protein, partial [Trifolium pratense]